MKFSNLHLALIALQYGVLATATPLRDTATKHNASETNTYDYIVTGSGPGGGTIAVNLARAGYSVLLVEAGGDASGDISTQILSLLGSSAAVSWRFFVKHSDDPERAKRYNLMVWRLKNGDLWVGRDPASEGHQGAERLGVYYPRGATLGGSAVVNAAATFLPSDSDWDFFDKGVSDGIWKHVVLRKICVDMLTIA